MEGPYLPEGSGGEEPPEDTQAAFWDDRVRAQLLRKERAFERAQEALTSKRRVRRHSFSDYTAKNCEEACGERGGPS